MKLLKPEEISQILGVSRSTVMRLLHENAIPAIKLRAGKRKQILRVSEETLSRWLTSKERQSQRAKIVEIPQAANGERAE